MRNAFRKNAGLQDGWTDSGAADFRPGLIWFHGAQDGLCLPEELLEAANTACVCISGEDWNRDLTPWPAERIFKSGEDFGGKAGRLSGPSCEKRSFPVRRRRFPVKPRFRAHGQAFPLPGFFPYTRRTGRTCSTGSQASPAPSGTMISLPLCAHISRPRGWKGLTFLWGTGKRKPETAAWPGWRKGTLEAVRLLREALGDVGGERAGRKQAGRKQAGEERVFFENNPGNHFCRPGGTDGKKRFDGFCGIENMLRREG